MAEINLSYRAIKEKLESIILKVINENHQDISGKENISNKVTSISSSSTNTQYSSAKCVYDNVKDKLERTTNDNIQVFDTLTDDARCKNSWSYWGQYQGLSNLTNSSFSLSAQGIGGVRYTNNDTNEEDVRLTVTLITSGYALIGDDEDYDNSSMYYMGTGSEEMFTLEYGESVWIQYDDTALLNFTYSVQGVTDGEINSIANIIYPIGSIYMSVNSTSPQVLFGGRWEQLKDRFLLGSGNTYSNGSTGGSADATLVSHQHGTSNSGEYFVTSESDSANNTRVTYSSSGNRYVDGMTASTTPFHHRVGTGYVGSSATGKNMPPYLTVYMWKRIA